MTFLKAIPFILILSATFNGAEKTEIDDNTGISMTIKLEMVKIESVEHYPYGLALKYIIHNNTNSKYFLNFKPEDPIFLKDGKVDFFKKRHDPLELITPSSIRYLLNSDCENNIARKIKMRLKDSLLTANPTINPNIAESLIGSLLFLDSNETLICTESISSLLKIQKNDILANGSYEFYFKYENIVISQFNKFLKYQPKTINGYKRYNGKMESNHVYLDIR